MWQRLMALLLGVGLFISILVVSSPSGAQFSNTDWRVSQLETELGNLRSQVNRLAASVDRRVPAAPPPNPATLPNPVPVLEPGDAAEARFRRLATLVVELRQEVSDLQARVRALETQDSRS